MRKKGYKLSKRICPRCQQECTQFRDGVCSGCKQEETDPTPEEIQAEAKKIREENGTNRRWVKDEVIDQPYQPRVYRVVMR